MIHISTTTKLMIALLLPITTIAQVSETVTINSGYTNQTFYSMANATISTIDNTDWDLGFQISGFEAAILINSKNNVKLFKANKDASEWSTMTAADTTGMYNYELLNNEAHMFNGAFNTTADTSDMFDLGWGEYDLGSHAVMGDSVYFIKLNSNTVKKIWIESLINATYNFRIADLDGSNEIQRSLQKLSYPAKNFGYYSIANDQFLDREPTKDSWDLCFQQYVDHFINYKVTGVLTNDSVQSVKAYPVNDVTTATDAGYGYSYENNLIGYDWKAFNGSTFVIEDSVAYFVIDKNNHKWKMVFTGFGGSANGNFYFDKYDMGPLSVLENNSIEAIALYPNPATGNSQLIINSDNATTVNIVVTELNGRLVSSFAKQVNGLSNITIPSENFTKGIYIVKIDTGKQLQQLKLVVQ